jgi:hypothetical protein
MHPKVVKSAREIRKICKASCKDAKNAKKKGAKCKCDVKMESKSTFALHRTTVTKLFLHFFASHYHP